MQIKYFVRPSRFNQIHKVIIVAIRIGLKVAQETSFFKHQIQMEILHMTILKFLSKGITTPEDWINFNKEPIKDTNERLRRLGERIPNYNPGASVGAATP